MIASAQLSTTDDKCHHAPDPREWIALDDAAELLGKNRSHLARECRDKLERFGLAMKAKPDDGGAAKWFIARRHDLKLAIGPLGEAHRGPDLDRYSKRQIDTAYRRVQCVESLREARSTWPGNQADWLPLLVNQLQAEHPGLKISESSLRRWYRDYQNPADLDKLIDTRGGNRRGEADPACWEAFKAIYLDQNKPSVSACWRQVDGYARREGLRWLTLSACRSQLDDRIPPEMQARFRDPKTYRDRFQPHAEFKPDEWEAGERWDGDHCVLDLMCWWGEGAERKVIRPWLTAWMDWRTRKIVGWHLSDGPNAQTILSAFRMAMLDESNHGGPGLVWIDNGKDYDSYVFHGMTKAERKQAQRDRMMKRELNRLGKIEGGMRVDEGRTRAGVFNLLGIEAHFSLPYNPTGKARLERWFGTCHDQFDKRWATYCGATTDKKPEALEKVIKQQPHNIPTFETVKTELEAYIAEYNATPSMRTGAEGLSPDQALATLPHTKRPSADLQALRQCLGMWHRPVKVTRNGVRLTLGTITYSYGRFEPALSALKGTGKVVHVRYDPEDMARVEVYEENMRHLCTATENRRVGAGKLKHKEVKKVVSERRSRNKQRTELSKSAIDDILSDHYLVGTAGSIEPIDSDLLHKAAAKHAPRDVKLSGKPMDLAARIRAQGGLPNMMELRKRVDNPRADRPVDEDSAIDILAALSKFNPRPEPDGEEEDDDILSIFGNGGAA